MKVYIGVIKNDSNGAQNPIHHSEAISAPWCMRTHSYKSVCGQNAARAIPVGFENTKQPLRVAKSSFTCGVALEGTLWVRSQLAATGTHTDGLD